MSEEIKKRKAQATKLKSKKKKKEKLPRKIIATGNKDKDSFKDEWEVGRDPLDFPRPYRCVLSGPPSSGKSCIIKNIMARGDFDEVYLCHTDSTTNEYDDVELVWQDTKLPEIEMVRGARDVNKLLIIEDMDLTRMSKEERHTLDRICGNVSSHSNLSIPIVCSSYSEYLYIVASTRPYRFARNGSSHRERPRNVPEIF
jgi:DNA replication protein DnaC